jgi:uncharacterized protein (TIGR02271 family)
MAVAKQPERRFPDAGRSHLKPLPADMKEVYRQADGSDGPLELVRHEEEATITAQPREAGKIRLRKAVDRLLTKTDVTRLVQDGAVERKPAEAGDSGEVETLEDGSISIPLFEEEIVVTKRMVVRERLIVRKVQRTETVTVPLELKRERIGIEEDESVKGRVKKG